jgi:hypothetical protein
LASPFSFRLTGTPALSVKLAHCHASKVTRQSQQT